MADSMQSPPNTGIQQQTTSVTIVETESEQSQEVSTVRLRLKKPANDKKVQWSNETVDNEDMNKKKSNCCCIYTKPRSIEEESSSSSSSESEDEECEHCKGHIKKKKKKHSHNSDHDHKHHSKEKMLTAVDSASSSSKPGNDEKIPEHKEENGRTN
ncbi:hypothetical protein WA026_020274 [Henosepilachna vigintioctopunctata]|uniref:E3 ubiquitin-protein ligase PPP1R11 n=1 Tax=Henosepilachna vigintioctopunctata TaxID=420089 RepID=A0AAW1TN23_9CUCU